MALIRLSDAINELRAELTRAKATAEGEAVVVRVGPITIELEVVAEGEVELGGKVSWWVLSGGASDRSKDANRHKLTVTLEAEDSKGQPIRVSQEQEQPSALAERISEPRHVRGIRHIVQDDQAGEISQSDARPPCSCSPLRRPEEVGQLSGQLGARSHAHPRNSVLE